MTGTGPLGQSGIKPSHQFDEHHGDPEIVCLDRLLDIGMATGLLVAVLLAWMGYQ